MIKVHRAALHPYRGHSFLHRASTVEVGAMKSGRVGLWQGGASAPQHYDNFKVVNVPDRKPGIRYLTDPTLNIERVPSPQDWVLVLEKVTP